MLRQSTRNVATCFRSPCCIFAAHLRFPLVPVRQSSGLQGVSHAADDRTAAFLHGRPSKTKVRGKRSAPPRFAGPSGDNRRPPPSREGERRRDPDASRVLWKQPRIENEDRSAERLHIPTAQDYPKLPGAIFIFPKSAVSTACSRLKGQRWLKHRKAFGAIHRVDLKISTPIITLEVVGAGPNRKKAEHAAYQQCLAKLHAEGRLEEVFDPDSESNVTARVQAAKAKMEEQGALLDVYNYCARFDSVPNITCERKSFKIRHQATKTLWEVTIKFDAQSISVHGKSTTREAADIQAALNFKEAAEKYQVMHGNENLVIKDSTALTSDNYSNFIEFLKIVRPGLMFVVETKAAIDNSEGYRNGFTSQILLNSDPITPPVTMSNKKTAESTALLVGCVNMKNENADLWPRYLKQLRACNGQILRPIAPLDMVLRDDCSNVMRETLFAARSAGLPDDVTLRGSKSSVQTEERRSNFRSLSPAASESRSLELIKKLDKFEADAKHAELRAKKADLPINTYRAKVLDLINSNTYSIVVGATGSGKTTQVPQILLEHAIRQGTGASCNILCTQPRRIAATSVATRVAAERGEKLQDTVGYSVRFDAKTARGGGTINYCTTGVLLLHMQRNPREVMEHHSHIVIDEVHERDSLIDFLLILLKKESRRRLAEGKKIPQIVLMSATLDTELFANYLPNLAGEPCPSINVPGRTFPVRERYIAEILADMSKSGSSTRALNHCPFSARYLDAEKRFKMEGPPRTADPVQREDESDRSVIDWKRERRITASGDTVIADDKEIAYVPHGLVAATVAHITRTTTGGAILVFLPGLDDITKVDELLHMSKADTDLSDESKYKIYMLHSSIEATQQTIFETLPPGCRKIILATNIAETSITIPDVQHVVDTGKLREKQYDPTRRLTALVCTWVSKSSSKQRAGRAGRVQNGEYYALFTKERYDSLRAIGLPELLRSDLQETCLDIKAQAFNYPIREFLAEAIEPPAAYAVESSVESLQKLDALSENEEITPLGRVLASLPVHPRMGKMILFGIIFRCLDPMLILGAAEEQRSLFINPTEARDQAQSTKKAFASKTASDHLGLLSAVRQARTIRDRSGEYEMRGFCFRNFMRIGSLSTIVATARQIEGILVDAQLIRRSEPGDTRGSFLGPKELNTNSDKIPLIKALLLAGLHPNLAVSLSGSVMHRTAGEKNVMIHPTSCNARPGKQRFGKRVEPVGTKSPNKMYAFGSLSRSSDGHSLYLRETTEATPLSVLLFGGKLRQNDQRANIIEIDEWLPMFVKSTDRRAAKILVEFRKALERLYAMTFNALDPQNRAASDGTEAAFLADAGFRDTLATGIVNLLERDVLTDSLAPPMIQNRRF